MWFAAGAFHGAAASAQAVDRIAESFRTGGGLTFDDLGADAAMKVERTLGPWSRLALVPAILPALDGVTTRLEAGARVADVGCRSGGAGLGALGLPPSRLEASCRDAGFGRFTLHDVGDPANLYYEVRP